MKYDDPLHPYQRAGADFLSGRSFALLADAMGIGKTAQAIRACDLRNARRILVVCPAIARINWLREFDRWSIRGLASRALFSRQDRPGPRDSIVVVSYDYATENRAWLTDLRWDVLICDEAHYLKSADTKRTGAIYGVGGLIHSATNTWALSGTPMTNTVKDLWPLLYVSGSTPLSEDEFITRYATTRRTDYGIKITGVRKDNLDELKTLMGKIMLRRKKSDINLELPPIWFETFTVECGPINFERSMFDAWRDAGGDDKLTLLIATQEVALKAVMTSIEQSPAPMRDLLPVLTGVENSMSALRQFTGLAKVAAIVELVKDEIDNQGLEKIVIFACHRAVIDALMHGLRRFKPMVIHGGTTPMVRQQRIDRFQTDPEAQIFIGNIQSCGTAVTLTAASEALFIEEDWTPANNQQAAMRVHRIGQNKGVRVRIAALANSTDEYVAEALKRKMADELSILG